jgi:hypothetical protein
MMSKGKKFAHLRGKLRNYSGITHLSLCKQPIVCALGALGGWFQSVDVNRSGSLRVRFQLSDCLHHADFVPRYSGLSSGCGRMGTIDGYPGDW